MCVFEQGFAVQSQCDPVFADGTLSQAIGFVFKCDCLSHDANDNDSQTECQINL